MRLSFESRTQLNAMVSLIFSVTQLVRYSFACHVSGKDRQDRLLGVRL